MIFSGNAQLNISRINKIPRLIIVPKIFEPLGTYTFLISYSLYNFPVPAPERTIDGMLFGLSSL